MPVKFPLHYDKFAQCISDASGTDIMDMRMELSSRERDALGVLTASVLNACRRATSAAKELSDLEEG